MKDSPTVLLVGPYAGDRLASIERYVSCLSRELGKRTVVRTVSPRRHFGRLAPGAARKWGGYVDKLILFPKQLRTAVRDADVVHICDQAAAVHIPRLRGSRCLATCFDLLAIRSARGEFVEHRTRWTGRRLQSRILSGLSQADHVACISEATREDLMRIARLDPLRATVVHLGPHRPFTAVPREQAREVASRRLPPDPFILHVGGNQWYKNREGVLSIFKRLTFQGNLVLAGPPLTRAQAEYLRINKLADRVIVLSDCDDEALGCFYSMAALLLFPSHHEGFGWPILEAQSCGCPVVTTDEPPMNDVGGDAAEYLSPNDLQAAAQTVMKVLEEPEPTRAARIRRGLRNAERFSVDRMVNGYLTLYREISNPRRISPLRMAA